MKSITGSVTCCSTAGEPQTFILWNTFCHSDVLRDKFQFSQTNRRILVSQICGDQVDALTSWRHCPTKEEWLYSSKLYFTCQVFCPEISPDVFRWRHSIGSSLSLNFALVCLGSFVTSCVLTSCRPTSCWCPLQTPTVCVMSRRQNLTGEKLIDL